MATWALDANQVKKYKALFNDLAAKAGGVTELEKSAAGLSLSGLPVDTLMSIWRMSDLDGNDCLCMSEYLIACALIAFCVKNQQPPPVHLPPELASSAIAAASAAPDEWTLSEAQIAKYSALFDGLAAKAGTAVLEKSAAGLTLSGLETDVLMKIWLLSDSEPVTQSRIQLKGPASPHLLHRASL